MEKIFENDFIKVTEAENGSYSFITIDNKTNGQICVHYDKPGYNDNYDPIVINPNRQVILLTEEENRDWIEAFKRNQIYIVTDSDEIGYYPTGCSMTQWNEDCETIKAEAERILNEYNLYDHDRNTNVYNSNQLVTVIEILKSIK